MTNWTRSDDELDEIGPENGPHPGTRRVCDGDDETDADRDDLSRDIPSEKTDVPESERDREDLDHRLRHPAKDDEVDRDGEVERAEPAQHCRRPTTVADLRKLDVGHDVSASPEAGEEKHGEHSAHQHVPPEPVSGDPVLGDETCDDQRGISRERRRDHRSAGEPPCHLTAGKEVLIQALSATFGEVEPDTYREHEIGNNNRPVDRS